jgi:hypothetical protein
MKEKEYGPAIMLFIYFIFEFVLYIDEKGK